MDEAFKDFKGHCRIKNLSWETIKLYQYQFNVFHRILDEKTSEYLDFPLEANTSYECFETETSDDVVITIDIQNNTPYIIFPGANYVELEVNGKGDACIPPSYPNWYKKLIIEIRSKDTKFPQVHIEISRLGG